MSAAAARTARLCPGREAAAPVWNCALKLWVRPSAGVPMGTKECGQPNCAHTRARV
jgi:hypothetical protein